MVDAVRFHFDPTCRWTWVTSRWIRDVAEQRQFPVEWRALSLPMLNAGKERSADRQRDYDFSTVALRAVEYLAQRGRQPEIDAFYTRIGEALHVEQQPPMVELLDRALAEIGADDAVVAAADPRNDAAVAAAHEQAMALVGPGVGSPIVVLLPTERAIFGPVLSEVTSREKALAIFDATVLLTEIPEFHELKRGRPAEPTLGTKSTVGSAAADACALSY